MAHPHRTATPPTRPPMSLQVQRMRRGQPPAQRIDWSSWYLSEEDDMGQPPEHDIAINSLRNLMARFLAECGPKHSFVGSDAFFAWVPHQPRVQISPDIYVLDHPPDPLPKRFETWQPGHHPPRFALEVVSDDWRKDYTEGPQKYAQLGALELVIFDPDCRRAPPSQHRVLFQVFRRMDDGLLVEVARGDGPVYLEQVGAWLVGTGGATVQARLALDELGDQLVPTAAEAEAAERLARQAAERELAELRAILAKRVG